MQWYDSLVSFHKQRIDPFFSQCAVWWNKLPHLPRDISVSVLLIVVAYLCSSILLQYTGAENNSALVFVLAVMIISTITSGYIYGISASLVGGFFINFFFMYPYSSFSLSYSGYPVAMLSMLTVSMIVCFLTSRIKHMAYLAYKREQKTKELYELTERLNAEKNALQLEADRESIRSNILRAVSHDLRTPLTSISGAAAVLMSSSELQSEKNLSLLNDIKCDADDLIAMVENLLSVTRIKSSTLPLKKQDEMLEEVIGDALIAIHRRFPHSKISLELSDDLIMLPVDPILIKQVISNLLENSIRHSGCPQQITLCLYREENWAIVEIRDQGRGLSEEVQLAIEQGRPLSRDCSGDSTRGMGIGLSVCQSIIKAHNGFFTACNAPEGGAIFRFGLPMEEGNHD